MLRTDGAWVIYKIQHYYVDRRKDGIWNDSSLDHFGYPPGFTASSPCWQETGIYGTFDDLVARDGLHWIRKKHFDNKFRIVKIIVSKNSYIMPW